MYTIGIFIFLIIFFGLIIISIRYKINNIMPETKTAEVFFKILAEKHKLDLTADFRLILKGLINSNFAVITGNGGTLAGYITVKVNYVFKNKTYFNLNRNDISDNYRLHKTLYDPNVSDEDYKIFLSMGMSNDFIAYLDHKLRNKISLLFKKCSDIKISDREIFIEYKRICNVDHFEDMLNKINGIIDYINTDITLKSRFLNSIKSETKHVFLSNMIKQYARNFGIDADLSAVLRQLLKGAYPLTQITAASYLGNEGMEYLLSIFDRGVRISKESAVEMLFYLGKNKFVKSIDSLKKLLLKTGSKEIKLAVLNAFTEFKDQRLADFLAGLLDAEDNKIKIAVIHALGSCGSVSEVKKLYILGKAALNPFLKNLIVQAIGSIQARMGGGEKGYLSSVDSADDEGKLSLQEQSSGGELSSLETGKD